MMVEDAVGLADPLVDFSQYDNDADGYVDALFVIHAGPGAEYTGNANDIWSHAWVTHSEVLVDGVRVWRYSMEPEYWVHPRDMTIGVYCHEVNLGTLHLDCPTYMIRTTLRRVLAIGV